MSCVEVCFTIKHFINGEKVMFRISMKVLSFKFEKQQGWTQFLFFEVKQLLKTSINYIFTK